MSGGRGRKASWKAVELFPAIVAVEFIILELKTRHTADTRYQGKEQATTFGQDDGITDFEKGGGVFKTDRRKMLAGEGVGAIFSGTACHQLLLYGQRFASTESGLTIRLVYRAESMM